MKLEETVGFLQHDVIHLQARVAVPDAMFIKEKQDDEEIWSCLDKMFEHYHRWQSILVEHSMQDPFESSEV